MDKSSVHSDDDTLAPMPQRKQGRRGTLMMSGAGAAGPRKSLAAGMLGGRASLGFMAFRRSKAQEHKLENTYRTEPKPSERVSVAKIKLELENAVRYSIEDYKYDAQSAGTKAIEVAQIVRDKLKDAGYERYKYVINIALFAKCDDVSATVASRAVWAVENGDTCVEVQYDNKSVITMATAHFFYFD